MQYYDSKHPVAKAVEPLREEARTHARQQSQKIVDKIAILLTESGNDRRVASPFPDSFYSSGYRKASNLYKLVHSLTKGRKGVTDRREPDYADMCDVRVEHFLHEAAERASEAYTRYIIKMVGKIGNCTSATLTGSHVWSHSILTVKKGKGRGKPMEVENWKTQQVINFSKHGLSFPQWPSRLMKPSKK